MASDQFLHWDLGVQVAEQEVESPQAAVEKEHPRRG
jgi:hypothetical protein